MSPILYSIYIEPLALAIENDIEITGLLAPNRRALKILQHSDDMTIFKPNTWSLVLALDLINIRISQALKLIMTRVSSSK